MHLHLGLKPTALVPRGSLTSMEVHCYSPRDATAFITPVIGLPGAPWSAQHAEADPSLFLVHAAVHFTTSLLRFLGIVDKAPLLHFSDSRLP